MPEWKSPRLTKAGLQHSCRDARPEAGALTLVRCQQVHGRGVLVVDRSVAKVAVDKFVQLGEADALISAQPGLALVIKTADCVPVLMYDQRTGAVAAVHSGWKGTALNVVGAAIEAMAKEYRTKAADLLVAIGPAICPKHYDVTESKDDRLAQFKKVFGSDPKIIVRSGERVALDLSQACRRQCVDAGVPVPSVELSGLCTYEDKRWPSYRREGKDMRGDIWSYIAAPDRTV